MENSAQSDMVPGVPFNQAYWVRPAMLMAGCYPGAEDRTQAHRQLKGLVDHGIRHVIKMIRDMRRNTLTHYLSSPETNQQIDLVESWVEAE